MPAERAITISFWPSHPPSQPCLYLHYQVWHMKKSIHKPPMPADRCSDSKKLTPCTQTSNNLSVGDNLQTESGYEGRGATYSVLTFKLCCFPRGPPGGPPRGSSALLFTLLYVVITTSYHATCTGSVKAHHVSVGDKATLESSSGSFLDLLMLRSG